MVAINLSAFGGMSEKLSPRLLPDTMSEYAENIDFSHGTMRGLISDASVTLTTGVNFNSISGSNTESLFKTRAGIWLAFDNDVDVIESPVAGDTHDRVYLTGNVDYPQITSTLALNNVYKLGLPIPFKPVVRLLDSAGNVATSNNVATETPVSRAYCITYVTPFGEESSPSLVEVGDIIDVYTDLTVEIVVDATPSGRPYGSIRVYRTDDDGVFRFLVQKPASGDTFTDTSPDSSLGEEVPSTDWIAPNEAMIGLTAMPNGITAGFFDNTLCFSEAYLPHAWPKAYQLTTAYPIVGLSATDTGLIVLTEGKPYIVQGADPAGMVMNELDIAQSCLSKKSIVDMGGSVIYSSPDGLVGISQSGSKVLTEQIFTKAQWDDYAPSTVRGFRLEDRYVGFSDRSSGNPVGFILDPRGGQNSFCTVNQSLNYVAGFNDLETDALYLVRSNSTVVNFTGGTGYSSAQFYSKHFFTKRPINFGVCQVAFGEDLGGGATTVKIYGGEKSPTTLIHTQSIPASESVATFRLPSGNRYSIFQAQVTSSREVANIIMAESPREIT